MDRLNLWVRVLVVLGSSVLAGMAAQAAEEIDAVTNVFSAGDYEKSVAFMVEPSTKSSVESFMTKLREQSGANPRSFDAVADRKHILLAHFLVHHSAESTEISGEAREILTQHARDAVEAWERLGQTLKAASDDKNASLLSFLVKLDAFAGQFKAFDEKNTELMVDRLVATFSKIEKKYWDAIARPDRTHSEFARRFLRQMQRLQIKITKLAGKDGYAKLREARARLAEEYAQELLYRVNFSQLYHLRALDPKFRLPFKSDSPSTRAVREQAKAALSLSPVDTSTLLALFKDIREKLGEHLRKEIKEEIQRELSDERLQTICGDLSHEWSAEVIAYIASRLEKWPGARSAAELRALLNADPREALPEFLAAINDELDRQQTALVNASLEMVAPSTLIESERQNFEEKVKTYEVAPINTSRAVARFVKSPAGVRARAQGKHAAEHFLLAFMRDLFGEGRKQSHFGFPETLAGDRLALIGMQRATNLAMKHFAVLIRYQVALGRAPDRQLTYEQTVYLVEKLTAGETLTEARAEAVAFMEDGLVGAYPSFASETVRAKVSQFLRETDDVITMGVVRKVDAYLVQLLTKGVMKPLTQFAFEQVLVERLADIWKGLPRLVNHNLAVHGERYLHEIKAMNLTSGTQDFFKWKQTPTPGQDSHFDENEKESLTGLRTRMLLLARILGGVTIIRQGWSAQDLAFGANFLPLEELGRLLEEFELRNYTSLSDAEIVERLSKMARHVFADQSNSEELSKVEEQLRRPLAASAATRVFYNYLESVLHLALSRDATPKLTRYELALLFERDIDNMFAQLKDVTQRHDSRLSETGSPLLFREAMAIRAGH